MAHYTWTGGTAGGGSSSGSAGNPRVVASGSGSLTTGAATSVAVTRQTGEKLQLFLAGFVSGTAVGVGPGYPLEGYLENPGTTTLGYNVILQNNSAVTIAYEYVVLGITP